MTKSQHIQTRFDWIDALKAFALIGILLNHFVEVFSTGPWFTNPSSNWPDFSTRMQSLIPESENIGITIFRYLGWLGDSGPGVFILLSGLALTLSILNKGFENFSPLEFYKKRLLRIFPLYIAIHLFILLIYIIIQGEQITIAKPNTLLSLLGIRPTDSLFSSLNPSWWFIWLIIQLYLIFPLLLKLLNKKGVKYFLIITLGFTILSRGMGILGIRYNSELYCWMTGSFFGTRLAEFAAGMSIAVFLYKKENPFFKQIPNFSFLFWSIISYIFGLICSFTWVGSTLSNLFVTLGLTSIFYIFWKGLEKSNCKWITRVILWVGTNSFAIFLLHQPFVIWASKYFQGNLKFLVTIIVLLICVLGAYKIDKVINYMIKKLEIISHYRPIKWLLHINCVILIFVWFFIEPKLHESFSYNIFTILITLNIFLILFLAFKIKKVNPFIDLPFWYGTSIVSIVQLYLFPANFGFLTAFFLMLIIIIGVIAFMFVKKNQLSLPIFLGSIFVMYLILFAFIEPYLKKNHPLETPDRWGEFPALQLDSTKVYSLIPNQVTHLKYNNYDYILKTNSLGMNYPEFKIEKPDSIGSRILVIGDAFTMPEGMEYPSSYTFLLERALNSTDKGSKVQVINAGVTGYGPIEELAQLKELVPLLKPDIVLYEFFMNEFEEVRISPEDRRKNIGLISNLSNIERFFKNSQIIAHLTKFKSSVSEKIKGDGFNWRYYKSLLYFYENGDNPLYKKDNTDLLKEYLGSMKDVVESNSAKFLICYVPGAVSVSAKKDINYLPKNIDLSDTIRYDFKRPFNSLKNLTNQLQINMLDLTAPLKTHLNQPVYFPDSWHWNPEGHKIAASAISDYLIKNNFVGKPDSIDSLNGN